MTVRKIIYYGHPILKEKTRPVEEWTPEIRALVEDMAETMYEAGGIGLAANQVGEAVRLFIMDLDYLEEENRGDPSKRRLQIFFNPEIIEESAEDVSLTEGCLSLPDLEGEVYRPTWIRLRAQNGALEPIEIEADGMTARCIQHELDHLDGILFIDRMSRMKRMGIARRIAEIRRQGKAQAGVA